MADEKYVTQLRVLASGSAAPAPLSTVDSPMFTAAPGDRVCPYASSPTLKSAVFAVVQADGIPTGLNLHYRIIKTTVADQYFLRMVNGLEACTVDWLVTGLKP